MTITTDLTIKKISLYISNYYKKNQRFAFSQKKDTNTETNLQIHSIKTLR